MKLQKGDYIELEGVSYGTLAEVRDSFIRAGFTEHESLSIRGENKYYGLDDELETMFYNKSSNYSDSARLLTPEQVISWDKEEDGWIEWSGGTCPVADGVKVDVRLRGGEGLKNFNGHGLIWRYRDSVEDIIAYRICEQELSPEDAKAEDEEFERIAKESIAVRDDNYDAYFKDIRHLDKLDLYRVVDLFDVNDHALEHAIKKLLLCGVRTGGKDRLKEIIEARDTLNRKIEMLEEDAGRVFLGETYQAIGDFENV